MDKMQMQSIDLTAQNVEKIAALFPNCVTEAADENGRLIVEANTPTRQTLRPCPEESVDWDTTQNLYIEGDNLAVLKLLQQSYLGKVKMIYIDPPYNTGNDFIYRDDFAQSTDEYAEESGQLDEEGNRLFRNTDSNGRFHSDWCSMIYSDCFWQGIC